ncbi:uncharacterized protein A4U43_C05F21960 [Asparagus officinalis]|uniref:UspA domain-containing protein n=1 Tax=Asparagus officinalis TaxID=4686 RepID=A0A5P1ETP0_ASPOF|nr:uncharacterized protein A4U43_C05F21960 [Asparagus officinalis]
MNDGVWEIEEEEEVVAEQLNRRGCSPTSLGSTASQGDDVYVAVGKKTSSVDALTWALKNVVKPSSFVYLVHVFPEITHIPTPLGMLSKSQVGPDQVESFMNQERSKRRDLLQKFLNLCHASKVQVDTVLIESDTVAKAVIELIPVLRVTKIVVGTTKSSMRKLKKGNSKAEQIYKSAAKYCEVKIICDGKEVIMTEGTMELSSRSNSLNGRIKEKEQENGNEISISRKDKRQTNENNNALSCICFPRKLM